MLLINFYKLIMEKLYDVSQPIEEMQKKSKGVSLIRCIYDIKDNNETQIINDRGKNYVNEEIGKKI